MLAGLWVKITCRFRLAGLWVKIYTEMYMKIRLARLWVNIAMKD